MKHPRTLFAYTRGGMVAVRSQAQLPLVARAKADYANALAARNVADRSVASASALDIVDSGDVWVTCAHVRTTPCLRISIALRFGFFT